MSSQITGTHGNIHVQRWENAESTNPTYIALIAHGYGEHSGRYSHVAERLVADGAVVYAPDHFGHGRSDGERALVEDVDDFATDLHGVADLARSEHPGLPVVLIGHSMGGLISTCFAQQHPDELAALVLSAPVIGGNPEVEALMSLDPIPDVPIDPGVLSRDPQVGVDYAADELVYHGPFLLPTLEALFAAGEKITSGPNLAVPTLWLHGSEDALAPLELARPAIEQIRGDQVEEKVYEGARHEIFNETNKEEVIGDVINFLNKQLATAG